MTNYIRKHLLSSALTLRNSQNNSNNHDDEDGGGGGGDGGGNDDDDDYDDENWSLTWSYLVLLLTIYANHPGGNFRHKYEIIISSTSHLSIFTLRLI